MRPIKFKGKRVHKNEWAYGFYMESILSKKKYFIIADLLTKEFVEVIPETVCQLIKVVNGVEIYEGDYDEEGNMIDYCEECLGYQFFQIDQLKDVIFCHNCQGNFMVQDHIDEFRILGNIND